MAFILDKSTHGKFIFRNFNSTQYKTYAKQYSNAKAVKYVALEYCLG